MAGSGSQWPNAAADPEALDHLAATAHTAAQQQQQDGAALHSGTPYGVAAAPLHCGSSPAHENCLKSSGSLVRNAVVTAWEPITGDQGPGPQAHRSRTPYRIVSKSVGRRLTNQHARRNPRHQPKGTDGDRTRHAGWTTHGRNPKKPLKP